MAKDRYKEIYKTFESAYDLTTLNSANDKLNLDTLIRNTIRVEELTALEDSIVMDDPDRAAEIANTLKKIGDLKSALQDRNMAIERQLGIDRKSRKKDTEVSTAEYIMHLKSAARDFLEKRLIKVYCQHCKILVFRFSSAYDHNEFFVGVKCPQCNKICTAQRKEKDIFYDLKPADREWRRKYPIEIEHPKKQKELDIPDEENEYIVEDDILYDD